MITVWNATLITDTAALVCKDSGVRLATQRALMKIVRNATWKLENA